MPAANFGSFSGQPSGTPGIKNLSDWPACLDPVGWGWLRRRLNDPTTHVEAFAEMSRDGARVRFPPPPHFTRFTQVVKRVLLWLTS